MGFEGDVHAAANSQALGAAIAAGGVHTAMPLMCLPYEESNGTWRVATNPPPDCVTMRNETVKDEYEPRVCDEIGSAQGSLVNNAQYQVW